jgi:hypothetical protein
MESEEASQRYVPYENDPASNISSPQQEDLIVACPLDPPDLRHASDHRADASSAFPVL